MPNTLKTKTYSAFLVSLAVALAVSCENKKPETVSAENVIANQLDFPSFENKFKYENLTEFSMDDTLSWAEKKSFYSKLDSISFLKIYQDTTKKYPVQSSENIGLGFFYSKQKNKRGLIEFTILTHRESECCDGIRYNIYALDGKLISSFRVAGYCYDFNGCGYYGSAKGKFLNDSTYELLSRSNFVSKEDSLTSTYSKTITSIKQNGTITQSNTIIETETNKMMVKICGS